MRRFKKKYFFILIFLLFLLYLLNVPKHFRTFQRRGKPKFQKIDSLFNQSSKSSCSLPIYDFWDPSVTDYFDDYDPTRNCDRTFRKLTELENGVWKILENGKTKNCLARCIWEVGGSKNVTFGEWMPPGPTDCEFLEAVCWKWGFEYYGYLHSQIIPKIEKLEMKEKDKKPNVFVFLIDSMSFGMGKRSLPKTGAYLNNEMNAVEFPFLNVIGHNSRPNGIALWFGKRTEEGITESLKYLDEEWTYEDHCERYLDNQTHLFKEFRDHGYKTALIEDWANTMIDSWPFCKGFKEQQVDHQIRPLSAAYDYFGTEITKKHLKGHLCRDTHHPSLDYLEQFLNAYPDQPKFAFLWLVDLAHGHLDGLKRSDEDWLKLLEGQKEVFDNSFTIFIGDHGLLHQNENFLQSEIGSFERRNPYLSISVPKKFRNSNSEILKVLKLNSKKLQTHYDVRATILDVLKFQKFQKKNFDAKTEKFKDEKGDSLIRHQPNIPRDCRNLPIPVEYCICQKEQYIVNDEKFREDLGRRLIEIVNSKLERLNYTDICVRQEFDEVTDLIKYLDPSPTGIYKIAVRTKSPGSIHIESLIKHNEKETVFGKPSRLDTYGTTTDCTLSRVLEKTCFCKNSLRFYE